MGVKVSDRALQTIRIERCEFHGHWHYVIHPKTVSSLCSETIEMAGIPLFNQFF